MDIDQIRQFAPQLVKIAQKHGISNIYVFGSVARGDNSFPLTNPSNPVE
jgi:predicted nucleotidyltransferase